MGDKDRTANTAIRGLRIPDSSTSRRVLVRSCASRTTSAILIDRRADFHEVSQQIIEVLDLDKLGDLAICDSADLIQVSNECAHPYEIAARGDWIRSESHWRSTWQRMLNRCECQQRDRLEVLLDRLQQPHNLLKDSATKKNWLLEREAILWVLGRTLQRQREVLDAITIERIASLIALPMHHAMAVTHGTYCIASNTPTARLLSRVGAVDRIVLVLRRASGKHSQTMAASSALVRMFCVGILAQIATATVGDSLDYGWNIGEVVTALLSVCTRSHLSSIKDGSPKQTLLRASTVTLQDVDGITADNAANTLATLASAQPGQVAMVALNQFPRVVLTLANGWERPSLSRCGALMIAAVVRTSFGRRCLLRCTPVPAAVSGEKNIPTAGALTAADGCRLLASFACKGVETGVSEVIMPALLWSATLHAAIIGLWGLVAELIPTVNRISVDSILGLQDCWAVALDIAEAVVSGVGDSAPQSIPAAIMLLDRLALLPELAFKGKGERIIRVIAMLHAADQVGCREKDKEIRAVSAALVAEVKRGAALVLARLSSSILGVDSTGMSTKRARRCWGVFCGALLSSADSFAMVLGCIVRSLLSEGDKVLCHRTVIAAFYLAYSATTDTTASQATISASIELLATRRDPDIATFAAAIVWAIARAERQRQKLVSFGAVGSLVCLLGWAPNVECRAWAAAAIALLTCTDHGASDLRRIAPATSLLAAFAMPVSGDIRHQDSVQRTINKHGQVPPASLSGADYQSLITSCIFSIWRAYGHENGP